MEELKTTIDNGEIQFVHIAPIGEFVGSDADGKPVPEKMTVESLTNLANKLNSSDEVLCDIDHGASKKGAEKETAAAGWFTRFIVDPLKGLFATLKLTKKGKELLENREYRYTSPTFVLDSNGEPVDMHSVSLTNLPAFKGYINPVLNTESTESTESTNEEIVMTMTKDELVNLIKETVVALNTAPVEQKEEDKKEEVKTAETTEEKKEEAAVDNACADKAEADNSCSDKVDDVKNEMSDEAKAEVKEEIKEEIAEAEEEAKEDKEDKKEDKKEEIITLEALNTAPAVPDVSGKDKWMNLHGDEFFKYLREHPEIR